MSQPARLTVDLDHVPPRDEADRLAAAVWIGPDSPWACPITFSDVGGQYPSLDTPAIGRMIQHDFRALVDAGTLHFPNWRHLGGERGPITFTYPTLDTIRQQLRGRDLACYCPPDEACHGDVLIRLARPAHLCPECRDGKHPNCAGIAIDHHDNLTDCTCTARTHPTPTTALAAAQEGRR